MIINYVKGQFISVETDNGELLKVNADNPNWSVIEFNLNKVESQMKESEALAEVLNVVNKSINKAEKIRVAQNHPQYLEGKSRGIKDGRAHKAREFYEDERGISFGGGFTKRFVNGYIDGYKIGRNGK